MTLSRQYARMCAAGLSVYERVDCFKKIGILQPNFYYYAYKNTIATKEAECSFCRKT